MPNCSSDRKDTFKLHFYFLLKSESTWSKWPHIFYVLACKYTVMWKLLILSIRMSFTLERIIFLSFRLHRFSLWKKRCRKQRRIKEGVIMSCSHSGSNSPHPGIMNSAYVEQYSCSNIQAAIHQTSRHPLMSVASATLTLHWVSVWQSP